MGCMWDTAIQGLMPPYCPHLCLTIASIHTVVSYHFMHLNFFTRMIWFALSNNLIMENLNNAPKWLPDLPLEGKYVVKEYIMLNFPLTTLALPEPSFTIIFNYAPPGFQYILLFISSWEMKRGLTFLAYIYSIVFATVVH